jgi:hypothetical protein
MQKGDYVLAHKWSDADPGDHWCVGFYDHPMRGGERHMIVDGDGKPFRGNGFSYVVPITDAQGRWMIEHIPAIDKTMFETGQDEWGNEIRLGKSVLEWLAEAPTQSDRGADGGK